MTDRPTPEIEPTDYPRPEPRAEPGNAEADPVAEPATEEQPVPEPAAPDQRAPEAEPHSNVEPVPEPSAPPQIAPEFGTGPIPLVPEPSVPEPTEAASVPPVALEPSTEQTLALPPTTKEVEPPPVPSTPPPPTGVPVPFASPPAGRGTHFGLKLGLGIGGGGLLALAVAVSVVAAIATFGNSLTDKVEATAEEFIGDLADADYDSAYAMLCEDLRDHPVEDYIPEWESWDAATAEVQPMGFEDVDVVVELADGSAIGLVIEVDQSAEALDTNVCGWHAVSD